MSGALVRFHFFLTLRLDIVPIPSNQSIRIAGTDTTSTTLSYLLWELGRRRDIMLRLQAEVDEHMHDPSEIPDIQDLHKLPYLTAVIKEGEVFPLRIEPLCLK